MIRTLVVDDHPFFCEGIQAWIHRQPNLQLCGRADSPESARVAIEAEKPDLVLLDLNLKDGDGFEVLRAIKRGVHQPRVICLTQNDDSTFAERALLDGARGYILKQEAIDFLGAAIATVLAGGIHLSASMCRRFALPAIGKRGAPLEQLDRLAPRELQVLRLLGRGRTTKEIAEDLQLSPKTVEFYREGLKRKLALGDSRGLVRAATIWEMEGRLNPPST